MLFFSLFFLYVYKPISPSLSFYFLSWPRKMGLIVNFVAFAVLLSFFFFPPIFISVVIYSELPTPVFY
ncbi:hypothetical protein V8C40DRAFT_90854 [Trichoderma camerunense]